MILGTLSLLCAIGALAAANVHEGIAATPASATWSGLARVESKQFDAVCLLPGADFRGYTKVMIDPVQVAFRKDWMKNINRTRDISRWISKSDAQQISDAVRSGIENVFAAAFKANGYEVVMTPGSDVLRLSPAVIDLYINAPDTISTGPTRTYTMEAGDATLSLEARDSTTGALLGRAVDRRKTPSFGRMTLTTSVTTRRDFEALLTQWAQISVNAIAELKARSPLP